MFELRLENSNANIVDLNDGSHYEVISASGFNPPSASLFTSKSPNKKGSRHNGSSLNERVIVIQIKLHGNIEESRNALYSWVEPEQYVKVYYRNGVKNVYCEGYIEVCDIDFFSNNEVVNVEILCGDPYLRDLQEILVEISNITKQFVFPFSIEHSRDVSVKSKNLYFVDEADVYREETTVTMHEGVPFSTLKDTNVTSVFNSGAETGVQFVILCTAPITRLTIYNADNTAQQFTIQRAFEAGWQIIIDTEASPKTCRSISPEGAVDNILRYVKGNPTWFSLKKGNNRFGYIVEGAPSVEMTVGFTNKFLGV